MKNTIMMSFRCNRKLLFLHASLTISCNYECEWILKIILLCINLVNVLLQNIMKKINILTYIFLNILMWNGAIRSNHHSIWHATSITCMNAGLAVTYVSTSNTSCKLPGESYRYLLHWSVSIAITFQCELLHRHIIQRITVLK